MSNQFNGKPETTITVPLTDSVASCNSVNDYICSVSNCEKITSAGISIHGYGVDDIDNSDKFLKKS